MVRELIAIGALDEIKDCNEFICKKDNKVLKNCNEYWTCKFYKECKKLFCINQSSRLDLKDLNFRENKYQHGFLCEKYNIKML